MHSTRKYDESDMTWTRTIRFVPSLHEKKDSLRNSASVCVCLFWSARSPQGLAFLLCSSRPESGAAVSCRPARHRPSGSPKRERVGGRVRERRREGASMWEAMWGKRKKRGAAGGGIGEARCLPSPWGDGAGGVYVTSLQCLSQPHVAHHVLSLAHSLGLSHHLALVYLSAFSFKSLFLELNLSCTSLKPSCFFISISRQWLGDLVAEQQVMTHEQI